MSSALFPKRAKTVPEQVDVHYELLTRHGKEFIRHADWITGVHQRVADLEKNGGHGNGNNVLSTVRTFGIIWTVLLIVLTFASIFR
jgi:hypothetical protein